MTDTTPDPYEHCEPDCPHRDARPSDDEALRAAQIAMVTHLLENAYGDKNGGLPEMIVDALAAPVSRNETLDCGCLTDGTQTLILCDRHAAPVSPSPDVEGLPDQRGELDNLTEKQLRKRLREEPHA